MRKEIYHPLREFKETTKIFKFDYDKKEISRFFAFCEDCEKSGISKRVGPGLSWGEYRTNQNYKTGFCAVCFADGLRGYCESVEGNKIGGNYFYCDECQLVDIYDMYDKKRGGMSMEEATKYINEFRENRHKKIDFDREIKRLEDEKIDFDEEIERLKDIEKKRLEAIN